MWMSPFLNRSSAFSLSKPVVSIEPTGHPGSPGCWCFLEKRKAVSSSDLLCRGRKSERWRGFALIVTAPFRPFQPLRSALPLRGLSPVTRLKEGITIFSPENKALKSQSLTGEGRAFKRKVRSSPLMSPESPARERSFPVIFAWRLPFKDPRTTKPPGFCWSPRSSRDTLGSSPANGCRPRRAEGSRRTGSSGTSPIPTGTD